MQVSLAMAFPKDAQVVALIHIRAPVKLPVSSKDAPRHVLAAQVQCLDVNLELILQPLKMQQESNEGESIGGTRKEKDVPR